MSKILLKFDNQLEHQDIVIQLTNSSKDEAGENYVDNKQEIQQTLIYGIQAPLIKINNIVVDFIDVIEFSLKSVNDLPTINMIVKDRYNLTRLVDTPGNDNLLRVQILPQFDNTYKKIDLDFFITSLKINNDYISITGSYKLPKLTSSNIKSFGEINTFDLFETIATDTGLGFATNVETNDINKKYVYCDNKSYLDILNREIRYSSEDKYILDFWVDFWNNLNLVNIYERYNSIDSDEDMMIWVSSQTKEIREGIVPEPMQITATLTNHPNMASNELYVQNYKIINNAGQNSFRGTDRVYSIYEIDKHEYMDHLIQDGDVKKDIFVKYDYLGESYGGFNYLLAEKIRSDFLTKMQTESIEVELNTPLLGLMRGNNVNFVSYINDSNTDYRQQNLIDNGVMNQSPEQSVPLEDEDSKQTGEDKFIIDNSISGQYTICGCNIKFSNNKWSYLVNLKRPASNKPQLINEQ